MLANLKHTLKHSLIYSLGNLSSKVIGLILLPLYTSYLSITDYGILAILETSSQFLVAVISLRLSTAMMRWWSEAKSQKKKNAIIFTSFTSTFILLLIFNLAFQPFKNELSYLFFGSDRYIIYFLILFISVSLEILNGITLSVIRLKEKSVLFVTINIIKLICSLGLNIYFIVYLKMGVKGIILSLMFGHMLSLIMSLPVLIKNCNLIFSLNIFKELIKFSFPLSLTTITMLLLTLSDRYILKYYHDYSNVGVYSLGYKLAGVINVFILQSFQMGFLPIAYKMYNKPEAKRYFSKVLTYLTVVLLLSTLFLSLFSKEAIILFAKSNQNYWEAYMIVPLLCLAYSLKGIEYFFALGLHYVKKTKYNAIIVLAGSIFSLTLNFLLIPYLKIYGAAITAILSELLLVYLYYKISNKHYPINYEIIKILKLFSITILFLVLSYFIQHTNLFARIVLKLSFIISFPIILYYWNFFEEIELMRIKQAWTKWKNPLKWRENLNK
ncbi:oligosaccharide flippase family protein [Bacteroidota bacterium]